MTKTFLKKGASVIATAALVGCMVPAVALADGTASGTGAETKTTSGTEVVYTKDCAWTATYPTSVTMAKQDDGSAAATIAFNVKGNNYIDVDHQVTIAPSSDTITMKGQRHGGTFSASITGGTAKAANVNTTAGATVNGSATATADAITAAAVDEYKGTTTFTIQCAKAPAAAPNISNVTARTAYSLEQFQAMKTKAASDSTYATQLNTLAESGNAYLANVATDSSDAAVNATLVNYDTNGLTFMADTNITTSKVNSDGLDTGGNFGDTELYTKLAEGGEIYNKFNSDILSAVTAQSVKVATNYNSKTTDAGNSVSTLTAQKLWLPSYYEVLGTKYASDATYVAGSSAEGAQMDAFKSTTSSYHSTWASGSFWVRSASYDGSNHWMQVYDGVGDNYFINGTTGVRPCFTL